MKLPHQCRALCCIMTLPQDFIRVAPVGKRLPMADMPRPVLAALSSCTSGERTLHPAMRPAAQAKGGRGRGKPAERAESRPRASQPVRQPTS